MGNTRASERGTSRQYEPRAFFISAPLIIVGKGSPNHFIGMNNKISVVINTYNAERHLARVLESLAGFDEVLVCDMESTDSTVEIASKYGCKVVTFPKGEHKICEPARDFAIHAASHDWVLVVDADELVPATLRDYLYSKIGSGKFTDALAIPRINLFMGEEFEERSDYQIRFFLKDKTRWPETIHSHPVINGKIFKLPQRRELSLIHLDNPTISQRLTKLNLYTDYDMLRRKGKSYGSGKMLFRPFWFFFRSLFLRGGIKHGRKGIVHAYMDSTYQMMLMSKITESKLSDKGDGR